MGVESLNLSCGLLPETSPVPTFFIAPPSFISLIKCLCEKGEAKVTVSLSAPSAAQLTSGASERCWASVGHHGSRTDHFFNLTSTSAQKLLHCGPLAHGIPLTRMPPLSFYWDLKDTELALGVLFLESPQPTHYLLFERQLQNALKYPHVTRERLVFKCPVNLGMACFCDLLGASGGLVCAKGLPKTMGVSW